MRIIAALTVAAPLLLAGRVHAQQPLGSFTGGLSTLQGQGGLSGTAIACLSDSDPGNVDTYVVLRGHAGIEVMIVLPSPAPQPGEYDMDRLRPGSEMVPLADLRYSDGSGRDLVFRARTGTLRLTAVSADRLEGTIQFLAQESLDPNNALDAALQFTAERVGGLTDRQCVRPPAGTAPTASASGALVGAQVVPGTATLAMRTQEASATIAGTVVFCRTEQGLILEVVTNGSGVLLINRVPARTGRFTVGGEDNEVIVSLRPGDGDVPWAGRDGIVRITAVEGGRVQGDLEVRIVPNGEEVDAGYVELGGVFHAIEDPRCTR